MSRCQRRWQRTFRPTTRFPASGRFRWSNARGRAGHIRRLCTRRQQITCRRPPPRTTGKVEGFPSLFDGLSMPEASSDSDSGPPADRLSSNGGDSETSPLCTCGLRLRARRAVLTPTPAYHVGSSASSGGLRHSKATFLRRGSTWCWLPSSASACWHVRWPPALSESNRYGVTLWWTHIDVDRTGGAE